MNLNVTHTYSLLDVSAVAYAEIRAKLAEAGYEHAFHNQGGGECIDMHGIALQEADTQRIPLGINTDIPPGDMPEHAAP